MSYEIYYDRAFIRVGERFIPLVNQGSNNCWETNWRSQNIPARSWQVLNRRNRFQLLFTEDEVRKIAKDYEQISQESGTCSKTKHRPFSKGEFERWILCGLKSSYTIEEYVGFGNRFAIHDYSSKNMDNWRLYPFSTTTEFLNLLEELKNSPLLNIHIHDNRHVCRPRRPKKELQDYRNQKECFILSAMHGLHNDREVFFCRLTKHRYTYTDQPYHDPVRTFATEKAAEGYIKKYKDRLFRFTVKKYANLQPNEKNIMMKEVE